MTTLTEGMHEGEFIGELAMGIGYHVDAVTVAEGNNLKAGAVVGLIPEGDAESAAKSGGNTGNGTFVLDATTPVLPRAKEGVYTARFTTTTSIRLEDPDGIPVGDIAIGGSTGNSATIAEQIKAVVTQGSTPFAAGDGFDVTISALAAKAAEYDPAGADGSQIVGGVLVGNVDATDTDKPGVALRRGPAVVNANDLVWKTGVTASQKAAATAALLALGIKAA